jgi:hypothetical protein
MKLKLVALALLASTQVYAAIPAPDQLKDVAVAVARTESVSTQINYPTKLQSIHGVTIYNTTPGFKDFAWTVSLCPESQPEHCKIIKEHMGLATGQSWGHTYFLETVVSFHAVGTHPVTAQTIITGGAYDTASVTKYVGVHY